MLIHLKKKKKERLLIQESKDNKRAKQLKVLDKLSDIQVHSIIDVLIPMHFKVKLCSLNC